MQFRLTKKFAKDIKISQLREPIDTISPLDDWFIDVIRVSRKKVAMVTHAKSTYTFFIPYELAGGAKAIPEAIIVSLRYLLHRHDVTGYSESIDALMTSEPIFCKTVDRKILGHMNDYKRCSDYILETEGIYAAEVAMADMPICINSIHTCPIEKLGELLERPDKLMSSYKRKRLQLNDTGYDNFESKTKGFDS